MPMLERGERQKIYTSTFVLVLLISLILLCGSLLFQASKIDSNASTSTSRVSIFSLDLLKIEKQQLPNGGVSGSIELKSGVGIYFAAAAVLAILIAYKRANSQNNSFRGRSSKTSI